jgi:hypothetical protein
MVRAILLLALLVLPLGAQQKSDKILVRFVAQQLPPGVGKLVMVAGDERSDAFDLPVNHLSDRLAAPARGFAIQPEDKALALAKVALPEPGREFIVLLVVGDQPGFTPVVLPAKDLSFRPGDTYLHNVSKRTIVGVVGTSKFTLPPKKGTVVRPAGARDERFYDVAFGVREGEGTRVISTTRWPVDERVRSYVFFFENPARRDVDFRAVDEFVPLDNKQS